MSCVIVGCKSHSSRRENDAGNISFHRFPTEAMMRQKWIDAIARTNWEWKKQHRVCSRHFHDDCFNDIDHKWRRLKSNAVPSLHLHSKMNVVPTVCTSFDANAVQTSSSVSMPSVQQQIDLTYRVSQLEQDVERLKILARRRLLKINSLRQRTKRLKQKNTDLNTRLMDLLKSDRIERVLLLESVKTEEYE